MNRHPTENDRLTPVKSAAPAVGQPELAALTTFLVGYAKDRAAKEPLSIYCEFAETVNPYTAFMLSCLPLLTKDAEASGRRVIWVSTRSDTNAAAKMAALNLRVFDPIEFKTWGDIAELLLNDLHSLSGVIIVGDVDYGHEKTLASYNGRVRHQQALEALEYIFLKPVCDLIVLHRLGGDSAFDLVALKNHLENRLTAQPVSKGSKFAPLTNANAQEAPAHPQLYSALDPETGAPTEPRKSKRWLPGVVATITIATVVALLVGGTGTKKEAAPPPTSAASPGCSDRTYVVREGDSLSSIAHAYGVDWHDIATANKIENPDYIESGQELRIPTACP